MRERAEHVRHYALPEKEVQFTLCGERIIPRDVHASWPNCTSCEIEVRRYWGDRGLDEVTAMWDARLRERDEFVKEMWELIGD